MTHICNYKRYRRYILRKIPCIVYYNYIFDEKNIEVLKIMHEMRKTYPLVLCYEINWLERGTSYFGHVIKENSNVVCFKNNKPIYVASAFNKIELHNLFQTVYNDCAYNYISSFNKILLSKKIIHDLFIHQLYDIKNPVYEYRQSNKLNDSSKIYPNDLNMKSSYISKLLKTKETRNMSKKIDNNNLDVTKNRNSINKRINSNSLDNENYKINDDCLPRTNILYNDPSFLNISKYNVNKHSLPLDIDMNSLNFIEDRKLNQKISSGFTCHNQNYTSNELVKSKELFQESFINQDVYSVYDSLEKNVQLKNYNKQSSLSKEKCLETQSLSLDDICLTPQTRDFLKSAYSDQNSFQKLLLDMDHDISINPSIETSSQNLYSFKQMKNCETESPKNELINHEKKNFKTNNIGRNDKNISSSSKKKNYFKVEDNNQFINFHRKEINNRNKTETSCRKLTLNIKKEIKKCSKINKTDPTKSLSSIKVRKSSFGSRKKYKLNKIDEKLSKFEKSFEYNKINESLSPKTPILFPINSVFDEEISKKSPSISKNVYQ